VRRAFDLDPYVTLLTLSNKKLHVTVIRIEAERVHDSGTSGVYYGV
jgi:hypothetical protein